VNEYGGSEENVHGRSVVWRKSVTDAQCLHLSMHNA